MAQAKANGIKWSDKDKDGNKVTFGIEWMRCSMAIQKHMNDTKNKNTAQNSTQVDSAKETTTQNYLDALKQQGIKILDKLLDGWKEFKSNIKAPDGYKWVYNGKDVSDKGFKSALIKEENFNKSSKATIDLSVPKTVNQSLVMQNRNRSNVGSIQQMQSIASNPDYTRLSISRSFADGAPIVAYGKYKNKQLGRISKVSDSDGNKYQVQYAVVEADDVLTSNNANGQPNEEYSSNDSSKIRAIAGNGRIAGMKLAYQKQTTDDYKKELMEDTMHGVDTKVIASMKHPVLVRVMQAKDITADIGDKSNIQSGLSMTAVEQANNDKERLDNANFKVEFDSEDGSVLTKSVKEFVGLLPISEQGALLDTDGTPTRQARERLNSAMFAKAYEDDNLTRLYCQALDGECKNIIDGLSRASSAVQELSSLPSPYDIRKYITEASTRAITARKSGKSLQDSASQVDLFANKADDEVIRAIIGVFNENSRAPSRLSKRLEELCNHMNQAYNASNDMFAMLDPQTKPISQQIVEFLSKKD